METRGSVDNEGLWADRECKKANAMHTWLSSLAFVHHPLSCVIYKYRFAVERADPSVLPVRKEESSAVIICSPLQQFLVL